MLDEIAGEVGHTRRRRRDIRQIGAQRLQLALKLRVLLMHGADFRLMGDDAARFHFLLATEHFLVGFEKPQALDASVGALGHFIQGEFGGAQQIGALGEHFLRLAQRQRHVAIIGFSFFERRLRLGDAGGVAADGGHVEGLGRLHRLDLLLHAALAHGEFRAQEVAFGDDLLHRHGREHLQAAHREPHGAPPEGRQEQ